jgi:hypothetical protein
MPIIYAQVLAVLLREGHDCPVSPQQVCGSGMQLGRVAGRNEDHHAAGGESRQYGLDLVASDPVWLGLSKEGEQNDDDDGTKEDSCPSEDYVMVPGRSTALSPDA